MLVLFLTIAISSAMALMMGAVAGLVNRMVNDLLGGGFKFNPVNYALLLIAFMVITGKLSLLVAPLFFVCFQIGNRVIKEVKV